MLFASSAPVSLLCSLVATYECRHLHELEEEFDREPTPYDAPTAAAQETNSGCVFFNRESCLLEFWLCHGAACTSVVPRCWLHL